LDNLEIDIIDKKKHAEDHKTVYSSTFS